MSKKTYNVVDLFSGAGGTAMGLYMTSRFNLVGVDQKNQPRYPFTFRQDDVMEILDKRMDVIMNWADLVNAAPPCQSYSVTRHFHDTSQYPKLIAPVREALQASGVPYLIENVEGARSEMHSPVMVCGSAFGLRVRRHRLFESNIPIAGTVCNHQWQDSHKPYEIHMSKERNADGFRRSGIQPVHGACHNRGGNSLFYKSVAMGIDWMKEEELNQAIPPAYSKYLGHQIADWLDTQ